MLDVQVVKDAEGRMLGYFVPIGEMDEETREWARNVFTDEEIEEARREEGGFTLQEILEELEAE